MKFIELTLINPSGDTLAVSINAEIIHLLVPNDGFTEVITSEGPLRTPASIKQVLDAINPEIAVVAPNV